MLNTQRDKTIAICDLPMKHGESCSARITKQWNTSGSHGTPTNSRFVAAALKTSYMNWPISQNPFHKDMDGNLDGDNQVWHPVWSTLPMDSKAYLELVKFVMPQSGCGASRSCKKAQWKSIELCSCKFDIYFYYT